MKVIKISCMNVQGWDDPATRECTEMPVSVHVLYLLVSSQVTLSTWGALWCKENVLKFLCFLFNYFLPFVIL